MNNLRILDGAKQQWALEQGITNAGVTVPQSDLVPLVSRNGKWLSPVAGERYEIQTVSQPPQAVLTKALRLSADTSYPFGPILRLNTNSHLEIISPAP